MGVYLNGRKQPPERMEDVCIQMTLDDKAYEKHSEAVNTLVPPQDVEDGDSVKVKYLFKIGYYGGIVEALKAVKELCDDPDVLVSASCRQLTEGRIMIHEVLKQLDAVIKEIDER